MTKALYIVVPCYNEEKNFKPNAYASFLKQHPEVFICFVSDGSSDNTPQLLAEVNAQRPEQTHVLNLTQNQGKAEAVRQGMHYGIGHIDAPKLAFLDADLSTPLEECLRLANLVQDEVAFCFGSRLAKVDNTIVRKRSRFLIGRFVATLISEALQLKVYDTQCGCKVFTRDLAQKLFKEPFISRWLFDVELFFRMIQRYGRAEVTKKMREEPLKEWVHHEHSKVKLSYGLKLFFDLWTIKQAYRKV